MGETGDERNGVTLDKILAVLDSGDAEKGRLMLKRWMAPSLLPCPCCGSPADMAERGANMMIFCTECGVQTPSGDMDDVIRTWNRRSADGADYVDRHAGEV